MLDRFYALITSDDLSYRVEQRGFVAGLGAGEEVVVSFEVEGDNAAGTVSLPGQLGTVEGVLYGEYGYVELPGAGWQRVPRSIVESAGIRFDVFAFIDSKDDLRYAGTTDELDEPLHLLVSAHTLELEGGSSAFFDVPSLEIDEVEIFVRDDGTPVLMRYAARESGDVGDDPRADGETEIRFSDVGADFDIAPPEGLGE